MAAVHRARARTAGELRFRRAVLAASGSLHKRRRAKPPPVRYPTSSRVRYRKLLLEVVARAQAATLAVLAHELPAIVAQADRERGRSDSLSSSTPLLEWRADAVLDLIQRTFSGLTTILGGVVPTDEAATMARSTAVDVNAHNRVQVGQQLGAVFGVDPLRSDPFLGPMQETFVQQNVELIESLTTEQLPQVKQVVLSGVRAGRRVEEIQAEIEQRFEVSQSRAELIARDQVGKLNAELTEARHRSVGIDEYDWDTSGDERVRADHAALDGTPQRYDDPPITDRRTGARNNPGQDYQCRCNAIPRIPDELLDEG